MINHLKNNNNDKSITTDSEKYIRSPSKINLYEQSNNKERKIKPKLPKLIMESTIYPNSSYKVMVEPYSASDNKSFAYKSVTRRWPVIMTNVIDRLVIENNGILDDQHRLELRLKNNLHDRSKQPPSSSSSSSASPIDIGEVEREIGILKDKISEGKMIISLISELKYESARDKPLSQLMEDGGENLKLYNEELAKTGAAGRGTWFTASWLLTECYLYRRLNSFFRTTDHWKFFDPFESSKVSTLRSSSRGMIKLTLKLEQFLSIDQRSEKRRKTSDDRSELNEDQCQSSVVKGSDLEKDSDEEERLIKKLEFEQLVHACLWGNATDLSLIPNLDRETLKKLQADQNKEKIIKDDLDEVWRKVFEKFLEKDLVNYDHYGDDSKEKNEEEEKEKEKKDRSSRRIDFVLDNSGFELFTDFILADWIVNYFKPIRIVFHPKNIPWFVSDVMRKDVKELIESISEPKKFFSISKGKGEGKEGLERNKEDNSGRLKKLDGDDSKKKGGGIVKVGEDEMLIDDDDDDDDDESDENKNNEEDEDEENYGTGMRALKRLSLRWKSYFDDGTWSLSSPSDHNSSFWTNPLPFWDLVYDDDQRLIDQLRSSDLVIFKGDLNYRKLTGDGKWESKVKFEEAIGPLRGCFNLLSLRTCKADVVVGLEEFKEVELDKLDKDWRINGKFGMISFCSGDQKL